MNGKRTAIAIPKIFYKKEPCHMNNKFKNNTINPLYKYLNKLDIANFKIFYSILVHYWASYGYFISNQNFFNLWCELNQLCYELDESFPDPYDDHEKIKSFCKAYPYYFIDILPTNLIAKLFAEHIDNQIDILANIVNTLLEEDIRAAYTYANETLTLNESVDTLVSETLEHVKCYP